MDDNSNQQGHLSFEEVFVPRDWSLHHLEFLIVPSLKKPYLAHDCKKKGPKDKLVWESIVELIEVPEGVMFKRAQDVQERMDTLPTIKLGRVEHLSYLFQKICKGHKRWNDFMFPKALQHY